MAVFPLRYSERPLTKIGPNEALRRLSRLEGSVSLRDGVGGWVLTTALPTERVLVDAPEDPFEVIAKISRAASKTRQRSEDPGWIGMISYEAGRCVETLPGEIPETAGLPRLVMARYPSGLWWHPESGARLCGDEEHARLLIEALESPLDEAERRSLSGRSSGIVALDMDRASYAAAFERIAEAIAEGDVYQVNLTCALRGDWEGHPLAFHERLIKDPTPPWASYLDLGEVVISSASPELLLTYDAESRLAMSEPIKGTAPRALDPEEDSRSAAALAASSKDRAEHVMIVDLVRNDLGRVCAPGSIRAEPLMRPMRLAHVHHLATPVRGTLASEHSLADLLRAIFPGGSITGAPKVAAMKIIDSLERAPRGVYCGAVGRISARGDAAFSLPIRTATLRSKGPGSWSVEYGAGGGIVRDSRLDAEYEELQLKTRGVQEALGDA